MSNSRFDSLIKQFKLGDSDSFATDQGLCVVQVGDKILILAIHIHDSGVNDPIECLLNFSKILEEEFSSIFRTAKVSVDPFQQQFEYGYITFHFEGLKENALTTVVSQVLHQFEIRADFFKGLPALRKRIAKLEK